MSIGSWYLCRKILKNYFLEPLKIPAKSLIALDLVVAIGIFCYVALRKNIIIGSGIAANLMTLYFILLGSFWLIIVWGLFIKIFSKTKLNQSYDPQRRAFIQKNLAITGFGTLVGSAALGAYTAFHPVIEKVQIPLADKFPKLKGLKIIQFSDLHIGALATLNKDFVEKIVEMVNSLNGDIIVFTGDLIDGVPANLHADLEPLKKIKAKHGIFYCVGNHEYYWGAQEWIDTVPQYGFRPLINGNETIVVNGQQITIAGVTDFTAAQFIKEQTFDGEKSMRGAPKDSFKLLLAHRPRSCYYFENLGVDLQLSGHTHGGQAFPWNLVTKLVQPYLAGLYKHKDFWLYVNRGTGFWGPPNRLAISGEVTEITLV